MAVATTVESSAATNKASMRPATVDLPTAPVAGIDIGFSCMFLPLYSAPARAGTAGHPPRQTKGRTGHPLGLLATDIQISLRYPLDAKSPCGYTSRLTSPASS